MQRHLSQFFTKEVAVKAGFVAAEGMTDPLVTSLEYDSRSVKQGSLFFALSGLHTNGSLYIDDAISRGAVVIVHEDDDIKKQADIVYLKVNNSRFAMSAVSASFYGFPSRRMLVIGVTGTEGKSTTVYLIYQLLTLLGKKTGFFSTVQQCFGDEVTFTSDHQTTPEAPVVHRLLCEMADNGCEYAVVEASSHGLSKFTNRLGDVDFCCAVLTNVRHDHLEFHGTWQQYRDDKANLFRALNNYKPSVMTDLPPSFFGPFGVINGNDKSCRYFANVTQHKTFLYSEGGRGTDIVLEALESTAWGNWYLVYIPALNEYIQMRDKLPGSYNTANVLACLLVVSGMLKLPMRDLAPFVKKLKPVKGRMSAVEKKQPFEVIVDFAHTPSSFAAVLPPLRKRLEKTGGRIICLFGSAGERDVQKRFDQGKIAAEHSDVIFLTDEDPRKEDPMDILEQIEKGVMEGDASYIRDENLFLIPDRPQAIRKAFSLAKAGDIVILLGKGHENSIIYAEHTMPYDEISEAEKALAEINYK